MRLFTQNQFLAGLTGQYHRIKVPDGSYPLLLNGRVDDNTVTSVKTHKAITAPSGKKQGIYAVGNYLILFVAGDAFWCDVTQGFSWNKFPRWTLLDPNVDTIYGELIPAGSSKLVVQGSDPKNMSTYFRGSIIGSPAALFVTDGVNQPRVILPNMTWRATKTYAEWTIDDPEYVPVCVLPKMSGNRLHVVDAATRTKIYSSVSGRPLDFVINRDSTGNKGGDANTTCKVVDYNPITAILPILEEGILISTLYNSYGLIPSDVFELFGESVLQISFSFAAGALNSQSFVPLMGDMAFLSQGGIQALNITAETKTESNSYPLGASISPYLDLPLAWGATALYDTKALFAVPTIFGDAVIVYDTVRKVFVSIDTGFKQVKQFAVFKIEGIRRLFFINSANELYEAYAGDRNAICQIYLGDFSILDGTSKLRVRDISLTFVDQKESPIEIGLAYYADGALVKHTKEVLNSTNLNNFPVSKSRNVSVIEASLGNFDAAWNYGVEVSWQGNAKLACLDVFGEPEARKYKEANLTESPEKVFVLFTGSNGLEGLPTGMDYLMGLGDHIYPFCSSENVQRFLGTITSYLPLSRFFWLAGRRELDNPAPFYAGQPSLPYFTKVIGNTEFFFYDAGLNSLDDVIQPDGNGIDSLQATWLRDALSNSSARFKIVLLHVSPYTTVVVKAPGKTSLRLPFSAWGANMVISADTGLYERFDIDGIPYVVLPNLNTTKDISGGGLDPLVSLSLFGYLELRISTHKILGRLKSGDLCYDAFFI